MAQQNKGGAHWCFCAISQVDTVYGDLSKEFTHPFHRLANGLRPSVIMWGDAGK